MFSQKKVLIFKGKISSLALATYNKKLSCHNSHSFRGDNTMGHTLCTCWGTSYTVCKPVKVPLEHTFSQHQQKICAAWLQTGCEGIWGEARHARQQPNELLWHTRTLLWHIHEQLFCLLCRIPPVTLYMKTTTTIVMIEPHYSMKYLYVHLFAMLQSPRNDL